MNAKDAVAHALTDLIETTSQFTNYDVTKHARSFTDDNVRHSDVLAHVAVEMDEQDDYYVDTVYIPNNNSINTVSAVLYSPVGMYAHQYDHNSIQTNKSLKKSSCCGGSNSIINNVQQAVSQAAAMVRKFQHTPKKDGSGSATTLANPLGCCNSGSTTATVSGVTSCPSVSVSSSTPTISNCTVASNIREVIIDNRGRVCIPKAFIDRIGKGAGDVVYVQKSTLKGKLVISAIKWSVASCSALTTNQVDCYGNVRITSKSLNTCNVSKITKNGSEYVRVRSESDHIVIE